MKAKARERHDVILEFGLLIQPLVELSKDHSEPTVSDLRIACAKIHAGDAAWRQSVRKLATFAPDIFLNKEFQNLSHCVERFLRGFNPDALESSSDTASPGIRELCRKRVEELNSDFYTCLNTIPVEWESEIFEANTPFTSYLKVKDAVSCARSRLHYFDRYLKPQFYEMFLRDIDRAIEIRIVTTSGNSGYGVEAVKSISELARNEFIDYQLVKQTPSAMHDRNLVVDSAVFSLGPSIDQAGSAPTNFSVITDTKSALDTLEGLISSGEVVHAS